MCSRISATKILPFLFSRSGRSPGMGRASGAVPRQERLQRYLTEVLKSSSVKFVCKICSKQFDCIGKFRAHESYHQRAGRYKCTFCGKTFHSMADTKRHERVHTGEKPYKCSVCGRGFTQITNRNMHENIHFR